jgi:uncharacterized membrane protein YjdF
MTNKLKVIVLWTVFLFGMAFHSLIALTPIFFGASVAIPDATGAVPGFMMWMSLAFYLLPMIFITAALFLESSRYKITNFVFTLLFSLMNVFHLFEHFLQAPVDFVQIALLTFVLIASILLNVASFRWMKE